MTRCGNDAPTSSTPSTSTRNSVSSKTRLATRRAPAQVRDARRRRRHDRLVAGEDARRSARASPPPSSLRSRSCRASARSTSAPPGNSTSQPSRSSSSTTARPVCGKSVSLKHVTNSATRTSTSIRGQDAARRRGGSGGRRIRRGRRAGAWDASQFAGAAGLPTYHRRHGTRDVSSPTTCTATGFSSGSGRRDAAATTSPPRSISAPATRAARGSTASKTTSRPSWPSAPTPASTTRAGCGCDPRAHRDERCRARRRESHGPSATAGAAVMRMGGPSEGRRDPRGRHAESPCVARHGRAV